MARELRSTDAEALNAEIIRALSESPFFADLTREQLESLSRLFSALEFSEGSEIYDLGQQAVAFYVLADGLVSFTIGHGNRHTSGGQVIRSGQVFGWAAIVEGAQRRIATAYCMTPCRLLTANGTDLIKAMDMDHSMGFHVMKQLTLLITGELSAFVSG